MPNAYLITRFAVTLQPTKIIYATFHPTFKPMMLKYACISPSTFSPSARLPSLPQPYMIGSDALNTRLETPETRERVHHEVGVDGARSRGKSVGLKSRLNHPDLGGWISRASNAFLLIIHDASVLRGGSALPHTSTHNGRSCRYAC